MSTMQDVQTQQQQSNTQQQKKQYINSITYRFQTVINGVIGATVEVFLTADLVKELTKRKISIEYGTFHIKKFYSYNGYIKSEEVEEIIVRVAKEKAEQTNQQKDRYEVVLDVSDVINEIDQIINNRKEEIRKKEEERRKEEEELNKIVEEINKKLEILRQKKLVKEEYSHYVKLIDGTEIHFSKKECHRESLIESFEILQNLDEYQVFRNVISELEEEKSELEEKVKKLKQEIEMLKSIIRKLTNEEELEEKLGEIEEHEEEELTKEEIKYLLSNVFDC